MQKGILNVGRRKKVGSIICHIVILYSKKWSPNLLAILQNLIWMEMLIKNPNLASHA